MTKNKINEKSDLLLSFDDYHPLNIRIAKSLKERGLVAIFFIETGSPEALDQIKKLHNLGMIIGGHTISHPSDLKAIPIEEAKGEIETCKKQIENITGVECEWFAYPRGRFNNDISNLVKKIGYKYARTTHVLKTEYEDPYKIPTTIHIYDDRKEYKIKNWFYIAQFYLGHVEKRGGILHLFGHAKEIDRDNQWGRLELFLDNFKK